MKDSSIAKQLLKSIDLSSQELEECLSTLFFQAEEGHLYTPLEQLPHGNLLPETLLSEGTSLFPSTPLVKRGNKVYLQKHWVLERYIEQEIQRISSTTPPHLFTPLAFSDSTLLPEQREAVEMAFQRPFFVLFGGPGTGKTYTAASLIREMGRSLLPGKTLHIAIGAPTGKAAMHLLSALEKNPLPPHVHVEATTLHRLLRLQPGENRLFGTHRIDADLILIDEASMLDLSLLAHLLEATPSGARLILMGDPDQLPPVESSSVFSRLLPFGLSLKRSKRTSESDLQALASAIQTGSVDTLRSLLSSPSPSIEKLPWPIDSSLASKLYAQISPLHSKDPPDPKEAFAHYNSFRILNALRQGSFGTEVLNAQIFHSLLSHMKADEFWAVPILITQNAPRLNLYNGTPGILTGRKTEPLLHGTAYFPDRTEPLPFLPQFELAFALSIHKSQGSEFEQVLALFPTGSERFGRESLYTAVTRAKRKVFWVGEEDLLCRMASHPTERRSSILGDEGSNVSFKRRENESLQRG